jgi:hypothetical protein
MGTSDACSLPLQTGPCDAAFARYGFNPKTRRCEQFVYGGCQGNANNFETFDACVAACGLADESGCPGQMPATGQACTGPEHPCDYSGLNQCSCQPTSQYECPSTSVSGCSGSLDILPPGSQAGAGPCTGSDCTEAVVIISYMTCSCDVAWTCVTGGISGGLK